MWLKLHFLQHSSETFAFSAILNCEDERIFDCIECHSAWSMDDVNGSVYLRWASPVSVRCGSWLSWSLPRSPFLLYILTDFWSAFNRHSKSSRSGRSNRIDIIELRRYSLELKLNLWKHLSAFTDICELHLIRSVKSKSKLKMWTLYDSGWVNVLIGHEIGSDLLIPKWVWMERLSEFRPVSCNLYHVEPWSWSRMLRMIGAFSGGADYVEVLVLTRALKIPQQRWNCVG